MTTDILLGLFDSTFQQIDAILKDVPDDRAAEQPVGVRNHPAWTMTHLCGSADFVLTLLGLPIVGSVKWMKIAGINTTPVPDRAIYPSMETLRAAFREQHERIDAAVREKPESFFDEPGPERFREYFPTMGHAIAFFLASHEHQHLGQLSIWMRAAGLKQ